MLIVLHRCIARNQVNTFNETAEFTSRNRTEWLSGGRHILECDKEASVLKSLANPLCLSTMVLCFVRSRWS